MRYDFSECHQGPVGAGPVRDAFAYTSHCDANGSLELPRPLLSQPCEQPCESNHFLEIQDVNVRDCRMML